jgi:hypothetical protein
MRSAAQAYGAIAKQVASPRDLEADLLLKAASRLLILFDRILFELMLDIFLCSPIIILLVSAPAFVAGFNPMETI